MLNYPFTIPKISGHLVGRLNRFVVEVAIEGRKVKAYLANPGRLWELLLPGTELLLSPASPGGKLPFTVLACRKNDRIILLHTHLTNRIVHSLIDEGRLPAYKNYRVVSIEPAYGRHRFDLLLEHRQTGDSYYLEIKSTTLFAGPIAMFPDAVTARGASHLNKLSELSARGVKTGCLFVIMNPEAEFFMPAYHIDYNFAKTFLAIRNFVQLKAVAFGFDQSFTAVNFTAEMTIPYEFLAGELQDRGVYMLLIQTIAATSLAVGALGVVPIKQGFYVYVGSAMNGLSKRISRHKRKRKKKRWHIDYLTAAAGSVTAVPFITGERLECQLAAEVSEISAHTVRGFGSSDCKCAGHLFYFAQNPLQNRAFIDLIQYYRILRPGQKLLRLLSQ